ncbi:flagellar assembly protein FliH [Desulfovibrio aminophilus]|nr:flagellar assembly protein FliH [Desulfovibrio aminophilus]
MTLGNILQAVQTQETHIFESQRKDFARLILLAVRKAVGVELAERRKEILDALLRESLEKLESLRQITARVAPEDVEGMELLLNEAKAAFPRLDQWQVKGDAGIASGGVVLETRVGMVDNSLDARWAEVQAVLDRLAGAASDADDGAAARTDGGAADGGA